MAKLIYGSTTIDLPGLSSADLRAHVDVSVTFGPSWLPCDGDDGVTWIRLDRGVNVMVVDGPDDPAPASAEPSAVKDALAALVKAVAEKGGGGLSEAMSLDELHPAD